MGQDGGRPERGKAQKQVPQHRRHLLVFADEQQARQYHPERYHEPPGAHAGQQAKPGRPGLEIRGDGDQVDRHD